MDLVLPYMLSSSKRFEYYGSMPNLMADSYSHTQQGKNNSPREFILPDKHLQASHIRDQVHRRRSVDMDIRMEQDRKSKGERFLKITQHMPPEGASNHLSTTMGDGNSSDNTRWRLQEEHETHGFSSEVNNSHQNQPKHSSEMSDQYVYETDDGTESIIITEHTENGRAPLTFSQAQDALNHMQMGNGKSAHRQKSGANSAESIYDLGDMISEDNGFNISYEQVYEAKIHEQDRLLDLMLIEKMNCEGRIKIALQYRRELENQLNMLRQSRKSGNGRLPNQNRYIPGGLHQLNYLNANQYSLSTPYLAPHLNPRPPNLEFENWTYVNRAVPMEYNHYITGSMDSIDELTRSSSWTPTEVDRLNNGQLQYMNNHHCRHNPFEAQNTGTQYGRLSYVPVSKDEEVRRRLQGVQRARPYSQERCTSEIIEDNFRRRRQEVAQLQQRRVTQVKRFLTPEELENLNLFSSSEYPTEQGVPSTTLNVYQKPNARLKESPPNTEQLIDSNPMKPRFSQSASPDEPIDPELAEICSRRNLSVSPNKLFVKSSNGSRKSSTFEPVPEISDDEIDSVRSSTPTQSKRLPITTDVVAATREKASPTADKAEQVQVNSVTSASPIVSSSTASDIIERQTKVEFPSQEHTQKSQIRILRVRPAISFEGKRQSENESSNTFSKEVKNITLKDAHKSVSVERSHSQISTTGNLVSSSNNQVPSEAKNPSRSIEESNSVQRKSQEIIFVRDSVRLLCLGPVDGRNMESHYNYQRLGNSPKDRYNTLPPSWIAVCHGDVNVSVYNLQSRACVMNCEEHTRYSRCPVVALLPFVSQTATSITYNMSDSNNDEASKSPSGLLCVVQEDGNLTLYNVANQRICGRISKMHNIRFATLLPHPRVIQNFLAQYILATTCFGAVICFQWSLTGYSREQDLERHPHWEGEVHDLGINIFDRLSENGRTTPYFCCICPQLATTPSPGAGSCSPRSPSGIGKGLPIGHYNLIAASQIKSAESTTATVRICRWALKSSQMKLVLCIDKNLACEPESTLIGITYAEIGGAASICLCMTADIFWFSLRSSDLVSSFRLPTCTQPSIMLPSTWPYKFLSSSMKTKPNERFWAVVAGGRVLELSAVESQRRRNASGRSCLMLLNVHPSDGTITAITSTIYEQEMVIAGTEKGEIHIIPVPPECYTCKIPNCVLGFCTRDSLIHHVVRDHFLVDCPTTPNATIHCMWPNCDYPIKDSNGKINLVRLETHVAQHLSDQ